jgi:hypothetical protein
MLTPGSRNWPLIFPDSKNDFSQKFGAILFACVLLIEASSDEGFKLSAEIKGQDNNLGFLLKAQGLYENLELLAKAKGLDANLRPLAAAKGLDDNLELPENAKGKNRSFGLPVKVIGLDGSPRLPPKAKGRDDGILIRCNGKKIPLDDTSAGHPAIVQSPNYPDNYPVGIW